MIDGQLSHTTQYFFMGHFSFVLTKQICLLCQTVPTRRKCVKYINFMSRVLIIMGFKTQNINYECKRAYTHEFIRK